MCKNRNNNLTKHKIKIGPSHIRIITHKDRTFCECYFMTFVLNCIVYFISKAFAIEQLLDDTDLILDVANDDTAPIGMRVSNFVNERFNMNQIGDPLLIQEIKSVNCQRWAIK